MGLASSGSNREDNGQLIGIGNDKIESGIVSSSVKHEKSHIVCIISFFHSYFWFEGKLIQSFSSALKTGNNMTGFFPPLYIFFIINQNNRVLGIFYIFIYRVAMQRL